MELIKACRNILLGQVDALDEHAVKTHWMMEIKEFSDVFSCFDPSEKESFVEYVLVCGNCFAIAKKLHSIFTTILPSMIVSLPFISPNEVESKLGRFFWFIFMLFVNNNVYF